MPTIRITRRANDMLRASVAFGFTFNNTSRPTPEDPDLLEIDIEDDTLEALRRVMQPGETFGAAIERICAMVARGRRHDA
jgi:hypothetical protein